MGVVSARIADEDEVVLKQHGVNVSEIIRKAAHDAARRIREEEALNRLDEIRRRSPPAKTRSEDLVREMRDAD